MPLPADPLAWAVTAYRDGRNTTYAMYEDYLAGRHPLAFATSKFRSAFGRTFETFAYNRAEAVVDAHADRMQVTGFGADDAALAQQAHAQWMANRMDVREGHLEADAFGLGQGYVLVERHPESGAVHYWVQPPASIRTHWSDDVPDTVDLAAKTWRDESGHQRLNLYFPDRVEKYISTNRAPSGIPVSATAFRRHKAADEPWPVFFAIPDTVPIFPVANNGRTNSYGVSELRHVLPLQDALNKTVMDTLVAMEFAAYPQRVVTGIQQPDDETKDAIRRFEAGVSRILTLYGDNVRLGEFSSANMAQYLAVVEFFDTAIARVTKVPVHYLSMSGGIPSGRALRIAEAPFTKKLIDRQRAFGGVLGAAVSYGLRLTGMDVPAGALRVNWEPAAPISDEDVWDLILAKRRANMPLMAALREAGYDPDQVRAIQRELLIETGLGERAADAELLQVDRLAALPPGDDAGEDVA